MSQIRKRAVLLSPAQDEDLANERNPKTMAINIEPSAFGPAKAVAAEHVVAHWLSEQGGSPTRTRPRTAARLGRRAPLWAAVRADDRGALTRQRRHALGRHHRRTLGTTPR